MNRTTPAAWKQALTAAGARRGDVLVVHSHAPAFGMIEGGPRMLTEAALELLGPDGTIVMPTFTLSFGRTRFFDRQNTPSETGALTELLRKTPGARRSLHPFHSVCAVGARADAIAGAWAVSSFGAGGPFELFHEWDALFLCAGVTAEKLTFVHYAEEKIGVPYRAMKAFPGRVVDEGRDDPRTYSMYARDQRFSLDLPALGAKLAAEGVGARASLAYGELHAYRARPAFEAFARMLRRNPGALLTKSSPLEDLLAGRIACTT